LYIRSRKISRFRS